MPNDALKQALTDAPPRRRMRWELMRWLSGRQQPAARQRGIDFPVLHLKRRMDGGLFDQIAGTHVEALWESAPAP